MQNHYAVSELAYRQLSLERNWLGWRALVSPEPLRFRGGRAWRRRARHPHTTTRPRPHSTSAYLRFPGCPWAAELPGGLGREHYLGLGRPVAGGNRPPGAGPASGSRTGQRASWGQAGRAPGREGGAAESSWAWCPGRWGSAAAGPPGPPRRCWAACPRVQRVPGPGSLHLWR